MNDLSYEERKRLRRAADRATQASGQPIPMPASAPTQERSAPSDEALRLAGVIADKIEDGTLFQAGIFSRRDLADKVRAVVRCARHGAQPATDHSDLLRRWQEFWRGQVSSDSLEIYRDTSAALQGAQPAASAEPVAWITPETLERLMDGRTGKTVPVHAGRTRTARTPLYAAPVSAQALTCRDLSDQDMDRIAGWLGQHEADDIGFQGLAERIIQAFAVGAGAAQAQPEPAAHLRASDPELGS